MSVKAILVFCAQVLLIQTAFSQCVSSGNYGAGLAGYGWGAPALAAPTAGRGLACGAGLGLGNGLGYGAGLGCGSIAVEAIPTSGGGLPISSVSAIAPSGFSIASENVFEGALSVGGELPFVSAVALDGVLPSAGAGAVSYSCGNGVTAIETIAPAATTYGAIAAGVTSAAAASGLSYGSFAGRGCGCGLY